MKVIHCLPLTELPSDSSYDVTIFSPLMNGQRRPGSALSTLAPSSAFPAPLSPPTEGKHATPLSRGSVRKDNKSLMQDKENQTTPLTLNRNREDATPPLNTSTPASSRSVQVRISARKLREIESPFSDKSSAASLSGLSATLLAAGASPGEPAPPPQSGPSHEPVPPSAPPLYKHPQVLGPQSTAGDVHSDTIQITTL